MTEDEGYSIASTKVTITFPCCAFEASRLTDLLDNYYEEPDDDNREFVGEYAKALVQGALAKDELNYTTG